MKKFIIILIILIFTLFLVSCNNNPTNEYIGKRYEVIITEKHDDSTYTVKTYNYKITNIWIMVTEDNEYEIGNIIAVVIVMEDIAVPYIEYVDNTIDGYVFKKTKSGIGWIKE